MCVLTFLDLCFLVLGEDGGLALIRANHEDVATRSERHYHLPNVHLDGLRVKDDLPDDRSNVFQVLFGSSGTPLEGLRHVVAGAEGQRDEEQFADVNILLQNLDCSHDSAVAAHNHNDDLGASMVALDSLLNHAVAPLAVIFVEHVEDVTVGTFPELFELTLHVACLVQELSCLLVATARIRCKENVVCVGHVH